VSEQEASLSQRKKPRTGTGSEHVTEMRLQDRAAIVRGLTNHVQAFQINVLVWGHK
jgi:hypothetical protein